MQMYSVRSSIPNFHLERPMVLALACFFGITVPVRMVFKCGLPNSKFGQILVGDPSMPSTLMATWPWWVNSVRRAMLAAFVWREYSLLDLGRGRPDGVYVVLENDTVVPCLVYTRFIMVGHGPETGRVTVVNRRGGGVRFEIATRGDRHDVIKSARGTICMLLCEHAFTREEIAQSLERIDAAKLFTFV